MLRARKGKIKTRHAKKTWRHLKQRLLSPSRKIKVFVVFIHQYRAGKYQPVDITTPNNVHHRIGLIAVAYEIIALFFVSPIDHLFISQIVHEVIGFAEVVYWLRG